jgi:regulatory protein
MVKITDLQPQKHDPQRFNVYLDGEFGFGIARVIAPWLKVGLDLTPAQVEELKREDAGEKAYQRALHYLSYRERSEQEVRENLEKHEVPQEIIEDTLERLRDQSLVNDDSFAETWVENRKAFHPRGKRALAVELRRKGVSREVIDRALEDVDEYAMAEKVAAKKIRRLRNLEWPDFRKKMYGYLSRRGFNYSVSRDVVQSSWEKLEKNQDLP